MFSTFPGANLLLTFVFDNPFVLTVIMGLKMIIPEDDHLGPPPGRDCGFHFHCFHFPIVVLAIVKNKTKQKGEQKNQSATSPDLLKDCTYIKQMHRNNTHIEIL